MPPTTLPQTPTTPSPFRANQPDQKAQIPLWREYWYVTFMAVAFLILMISIVVRSLLPEPPPKTGQSNSWGQITPGFTTINQAAEQLGQPITNKQTPLGIESTFQSYEKYSPHRVVADQDGVVRFVKEFIRSSDEHTLDQYTNLYGQPDLQLKDQKSSPALTAHVFLNEGLVVLAHIADDTVEQKWYFEPTDEDNFLQSWGATLTSSPRGPEVIEAL